MKVSPSFFPCEAARPQVDAGGAAGKAARSGVPQVKEVGQIDGGMNGHFILALPLPSRSACNNPAMLAIAACLLRTILCHLAIVGSKSYEGDEPTLRKRAKPKWIEKTNCLFLAVLLI